MNTVAIAARKQTDTIIQIQQDFFCVFYINSIIEQVNLLCSKVGYDSPKHSPSGTGAGMKLSTCDYIISALSKNTFFPLRIDFFFCNMLLRMIGKIDPPAIMHIISVIFLHQMRYDRFIEKFINSTLMEKNYD